jgi:hypothetical protein
MKKMTKKLGFNKQKLKKEEMQKKASFHCCFVWFCLFFFCCSFMCWIRDIGYGEVAETPEC